jgi:AraC family transcriptional regulator
MIPRIAIFPETKVIGMRMTMSYSDYKARELGSVLCREEKKF